MARFAVSRATLMVRARFSILDLLIYLFLILLSGSFLYPLANQLALSISDAGELGWQRVNILPVGFSLDSYRALLSDTTILRYYINTIKYAAVGTVIMLATTALMAYPLTFPDLRGRKLVMVLLVLTMFFSGGLVPYYLLVLSLGLVDTMWALVLPNAIVAWNVIIFRTFFRTVPGSLRESAHIDGAGHFLVLFRIVLPISKPLLATFVLFSLVGYWNDYFWALIFLRDQDKQPIQLFLRRILILVDLAGLQDTSALQIFTNLSSRTMKAAALIITITPILCVYPFLQKYFTKGLLVGSLKD